MSEALGTYLADHYAGSAGGGELCRRIADSAAGDEEAREIGAIADEIDSEQQTLEAIMNRVGAEPSSVKAAGAWIGEKAGRVKLRAADDAGRVLQYEAMIMGVTGKLMLWRSLIEIAGDTPGLERGQLEELARQAESQRARLERWHDTAAEGLLRDA